MKNLQSRAHLGTRSHRNLTSEEDNCKSIDQCLFPPLLELHGKDYVTSTITVERLE